MSTFKKLLILVCHKKIFNRKQYLAINYEYLFYSNAWVLFPKESGSKIAISDTKPKPRLRNSQVYLTVNRLIITRENRGQTFLFNFVAKPKSVGVMSWTVEYRIDLCEGRTFFFFTILTRCRFYTGPNHLVWSSVRVATRWL